MGTVIRDRPKAAALLLALAVITAAGCGTQTASVPVTQHQRPEGMCPPPDSAAAARATPCLSAGVQQYQQSNDMFQQRSTLPAARAAAAAPTAHRARLALEQLTPVQRQWLGPVRAALIAAGLPVGGIYVKKVYIGMTSNGKRVDGTMFGAFTSMTGPSACVYGTAAPASVTVSVGGIINDGGCLPGPGGH
jgi:hypothetical protein